MRLTRRTADDMKENRVDHEDVMRRYLDRKKDTAASMGSVRCCTSARRANLMSTTALVIYIT